MTQPTFGSVSAEELALFTDLYELRMMQGYLESGHDPTVTFDLFFRSLPPDRGYVVAAGLEQAIAYLETLSFDDGALSYLADLGFPGAFLASLDRFEFTGDVRALPEGTVAFPNEPLVEVTAPISEAQLFETALINQVGFGSLIATKAARMREAVAASGDDQSLVDFGSRRAHGIDAGLKAARAAYVGGFTGTSNVAAGRAFDLPVFGTMAHSWVQSFPTEREAFEAFVEVYGEDSVLLVDTYDTVGGARTAMAVSEEMGVDVAGVRLDSGDLVELSREVAKVVEDAGIFVSSGMDEYGIEAFLADGGVATGFGPGTALVTSEDAPSLDAVYKLAAVERDGESRPSTKLSPGKVTYPGRKSVRRVERDGRFRRDVLALRGEDVEGDELLVDVFEDGSLVYSPPPLAEIRDRTRGQVTALPRGTRRLRDPEAYPVEISDGLRSTTEAVRADLSARYREDR
ncbi:nicotinate phosphoribosyltransferase [Halorarum salinum]|uniref:nicotinate phosphoribosyltransferase n=1 Tax=Halorarum salinum TaxID=2743089 RepID=A0A7D5L9B3_9EURY|nr:nicotinate phosphoribosyltransferase [Halobaculum salinum]QLG61132.1 nicotinate phosphoribosyltransferase [Halobaculum salinum]